MSDSEARAAIAAALRKVAGYIERIANGMCDEIDGPGIRQGMDRAAEIVRAEADEYGPPAPPEEVSPP